MNFIGSVLKICTLDHKKQLIIKVITLLIKHKNFLKFFLFDFNERMRHYFSVPLIHNKTYTVLEIYLFFEEYVRKHRLEIFKIIYWKNYKYESMQSLNIKFCRKMTKLYNNKLKITNILNFDCMWNIRIKYINPCFYLNKDLNLFLIIFSFNSKIYVFKRAYI